MAKTTGKRSKLASSLCLALVSTGMALFSCGLTNTACAVEQRSIIQSERAGGNDVIVHAKDQTVQRGFGVPLADGMVSAKSTKDESSLLLGEKCRGGDGTSCDTLAKQALRDYDARHSVSDLKSAIMLATSACAYRSQSCKLKADLFYRAYTDRVDIDTFLPGHYIRDEIIAAYDKITEFGSTAEAAEAYYRMGEVNTDFKRISDAQKNFAQSCKTGGGAYCVKAASFLTSHGQKKASGEMFKQACDLGEVSACLSYGETLYSSGQTTQAAKLYEKACNANNATACRLLGQHYAKTKSRAKALPLWVKACSFNDSASCLLAASSAAHSGNIGQASTSFNKSCELGNTTACHFMGDYELNQGLVTTAIANLSKACAAKNSQACYTLGLLQNQAESQRSFDLACNLGHKQACNNLAKTYNSTDTSAIAAYEKSCNLKDANSCLQWGMALAANNKTEGAKSALEKACNLKNSIACERLGALYNYARDDANAVKFQRKACGFNAAGACTQVGLAYSLGKGVKKNNKQAILFFNKACKLGAADACVLVK